MQCSRPQSRDQAALTGQYCVKSRVVGQHRKNNVSISRGSFGALYQHGAGVHQRSGLLGTAIPYRDVVSCAHQIGGDGRAHIAKTDEADSHCASSYR
jgi:hypothetical protein